MKYNDIYLLIFVLYLHILQLLCIHRLNNIYFNIKFEFKMPREKKYVMNISPFTRYLQFVT